MPKHNKPSTPEAEIAAEFGAELHALCKSLGWDDPKQLGDLVGYNYKTIYNAWNTGRVSWECVKAIITNLHEDQFESPDQPVELWYTKWSGTRAQIEEARASFDARLTEVVEHAGQNSADIAALRCDHDSVLARIEALEQRAAFGSGRDAGATLHLEPIRGAHSIPVAEPAPPDPAHGQGLEQIQKYIAWAEQEAQRKREEAREASRQAEWLEWWAREARRDPVQFLLPAEHARGSALERSVLPEQHARQE